VKAREKRRGVLFGKTLLQQKSVWWGRGDRSLTPGKNCWERGSVLTVANRGQRVQGKKSASLVWGAGLKRKKVGVLAEETLQNFKAE